MSQGSNAPQAGLRTVDKFAIALLGTIVGAVVYIAIRVNEVHRLADRTELRVIQLRDALHSTGQRIGAVAEEPRQP